MTRLRFHSLAEAAEVHREELRRFVQRRAGCPALADDIVQDTWVRAHGAVGAMPQNPRAYLFRMASNLLVDHLRRARPADDLVTPAPDLERFACPAPPPDAVVGARQELGVLRDAIAELPERCREVFLLYRGEGLTMRRIARQLGISEKTVEKHIARAMVHCRCRLREAGRNV